MRLSLVSRAVVGIWALWFTAALSEVPGLHACAIHDGHVMHGGMAGQIDHAGHMAHESQSAPADHSKHPAGCTCLGLCCCAAPAIAPSAPVELASVVVVAVRVAEDRDVASPIVHRAYSLPFANGPPAA